MPTNKTALEMLIEKMTKDCELIRQSTEVTQQHKNLILPSIKAIIEVIEEHYLPMERTQIEEAFDAGEDNILQPQQLTASDYFTKKYKDGE